MRPLEEVLADALCAVPANRAGRPCDEHRELAGEAAAAVCVWLTEALAAPEVEGKAARAVKEIDDSGLPAIWARQYARAALSAAADALRAGVTR